MEGRGGEQGRRGLYGCHGATLTGIANARIIKTKVLGGKKKECRDEQSVLWQFFFFFCSEYVRTKQKTYNEIK